MPTIWATRTRMWVPPWSRLDPYGEGVLAWLLAGDYEVSDWVVVYGAAEGATGGATIVADTFTFGQIDALNAKAATYQGADYTASRFLAVGSREILITAGTMGVGTAAVQGGRAAQVAHKGILVFEAGTGGYQVGTGIDKAIQGDYTGGALDVAAGALRVGGAGLSARQFNKAMSGADDLARAADDVPVFGSRASRGAELRGKYGERFAEYSRHRGQGFTPAQAKYLSEPYSGVGHHFPIRQVTGRNRSLSQRIVDSPLNVLKPRGITRGRFYELHYKVDPTFYGTSFPRRIGGVWQGRGLGIDKLTGFSRMWHATPGPLKTSVGAAGAAAGGGAAYWYFLDEE
jgi:hypothetical protein